MMTAVALIQLGAGGNPSEAHVGLHAVPGVKTVYLLAGPTDMLAVVDAADQAALTETLLKIRAVKGVASTDTRIVLPM